MSMTMTDLDHLNRAHEVAVKEMNRCAVAIAEAVADGRKPTRQEVDAYRVSKLGVESTSRDLEYCLQLELQELLG